MEEADMLSDRIAIMAGGSLSAVGTSLELKARYGAGYTLSVLTNEAASGAPDPNERSSSEEAGESTHLHQWLGPQPTFPPPFRPALPFKVTFFMSSSSSSSPSSPFVSLFFFLFSLFFLLPLLPFPLLPHPPLLVLMGIVHPSSWLSSPRVGSRYLSRSVTPPPLLQVTPWSAW